MDTTGEINVNNNKCTHYLKRFKRYCKLSTQPNYNYCSRHMKHQKPLQILDKPDECQVCIEKFTDKDTPLTCGHWIHRECVVKSGKNLCPLCRFQLNLTKKEKQECTSNRNRMTNYNHPIRIQTTLGAQLDALLHTYPIQVQQFINEVGLHNILDINVHNINPLRFQCALINYINLHHFNST